MKTNSGLGPCVVCEDPDTRSCEVCKSVVCDKHYVEARCCKRLQTLKTFKASLEKRINDSRTQHPA